MFVLPSGVTVVDHPLIAAKLTELRAAETPLAIFRQRLSEITTLMAFEVTRTLPTVPRIVQTPMAVYEGAALARPVVLAPILRAGLGMLEGMLKVLPDASVAHIGLFRNEETHEPETYYFRAPGDLASVEVIVCDPMLATGGSAVAAITQLRAAGARAVRYMCLVSCAEGIARLRAEHPEVPVFTAAVDPVLNTVAYIVPGLGDAGDRYFGTV